MTKTRKPVSLLIHPSLDGEAMDKLREQGHVIWDMEEWKDELQHSGSGMCDVPPTDFDLVLGPNCWWMPPEHIDLLPTALKAAREERYKDQPKPKKKVKRDKG